MAALLLTRHWDSDDSLNCLDEILNKEHLKPNEKSQKEDLLPKPENQTNSSKQESKRKPANASSKNANTKSSRHYKDIVLENSNV